jgi:hypothetical protein
MGQKYQDVPARLASLERRFAGWRSRRSKGERIPHHLWKAATKLALEFGLNRTAKRLKIDYYHLKKRLDRDRLRSTSESAFVELPPVPFRLPSECLIEFDDGRGASMRVHLKGAEAPDLLALGRSFWTGE